MRIAVTKVAKRSEIGKDSQTPLSPNCPGNHKSNGTRKMTCRINPKKIDFAALPRLWKRHVEIIWKPTTENANMLWRKALSETEISSVESVKALATVDGKQRPTTLPPKVRIVATPTASQ